MFAKELSTVYENYFQYKNWNFEVISETADTEQLKELIYSVTGESFADLQFETGVHRVQRVPRTDSQGRIHTSTVTVTAIPQYADDISPSIEKDVRMDVFRSSGPGGQNVNKTNSAVRLVHIPTGITVSMQDERSQILNKVKAFKVLEFRLQERNRSLKSQAIKTLRNEQVALNVQFIIYILDRIRRKI
jgi:peptide chain release factor 1